MSQQLVKKGANGKHENVMPRSWIEAIKDKYTGQSLLEILQGFNMYFLSYTGNKENTRLQVPMNLRKRGLWVVYENYDNEVIVEWYDKKSIEDEIWKLDSSWKRVPLTSDIKFKIENGMLYVSYNNGKSWEELGILSDISTTSDIVPDEEDITAIESEGIKILKFKDRDTTKGKGYIILRTDKPIAEQMKQENTIYEIRYDFDLGGETLEVPTNCVLEFKGGSFKSGTILGLNTTIKAEKPFVIFDKVTINGTFNVDCIYDRWFSYVEGEDNTSVIKSIIALSNANISNKIVIDRDTTYNVSVSENLERVIIPTNNTELVIDSNIQLMTNEFTHYGIIGLIGVNNINIHGSGHIIGDVETHTGTTGEWGFGIEIRNSQNINISGITLEKCWGDGISTDEGGGVPENILIENVVCDNNRRQGISIVLGKNVIVRNSTMQNTGQIKYTGPGCGIDVEPTKIDGTNPAENILIENCRFYNNKGGSMTLTRYLQPTDNVVVMNCYGNGNLIISGVYNTTIINSSFSKYTAMGDNYNLNHIDCNYFNDKRSANTISPTYNNVVDCKFKTEDVGYTIQQSVAEITAEKAIKIIVPDFVGMVRITVVGSNRWIGQRPQEVIYSNYGGSWKRTSNKLLGMFTFEWQWIRQILCFSYNSDGAIYARFFNENDYNTGYTFKIEYIGIPEYHINYLVNPVKVIDRTGIPESISFAQSYDNPMYVPTLETGYMVGSNGMSIFDSDRGKPLWYHNGEWVDASGGDPDEGSTNIATKAQQDGEGNDIVATYATKTSVSGLSNKAESALTNSTNAIQVANEASSTAEDAVSTSAAAESTANNALQTATIAKNAVATLEGLANATTAQEVLAGQVLQIETNKTDIRNIKELQKAIFNTEYVAEEYPSSLITKGKYLISDNSYETNANYSSTDYIEYPSSASNYLYLRNAGLGGGYILFFNANKEKVGAFQGNDSSISTMLDSYYCRISRYGGATYIRVSYIHNEKPLLYQFDAEIEEQSDDSLKDGIVGENNLKEDVKAKLSKKVYPLMMNNWTHNRYYDKNGIRKDNADGYYSCATYDVSRVNELKDVEIVLGGGLPSDLCPLVMFDGSGNVINYIESTSGISEDSLDVSYAHSIAVSFRCNTIPHLFTDEPNKVVNIYSNETLTSGIKYIAPISYIKKNVVVNVCFKVLSSFTYLTIGRGQADYFKYSVKISKSSVICDSKTDELGFTLANGDLVSVTIKADRFNKNTVIIERGSDVLEVSDVALYGDGSTYLQSDGVIIMGANTTYMDATRSVYFYGDSYSGTKDAGRWPYEAARMGCEFLVNGLTGGTSKDMLAQLALDMSRIGVPKVVVWSLGMNDGTDTDNNTPNSNWSSYITWIDRYCKKIGVMFIPCTIPSVPGRNHNAKNAYIKEHYSSYIDFAAAVDNGIDNKWVDGALYSDNVHPTVYGAKLLAIKAVADCQYLVK